MPTEQIGCIDVSIVVPMYNEEAGIPEFIRQIRTVLGPSKFSFEIVAVNDGSKDGTLAVLTDFASKFRNIRVVDLSRNFGKEAALTAGIELSLGRAVVPIDADLQHPPQVILEMLEKWEQGFEVVIGIRTSRTGESFLKRKTAELFYRFSNRISNIEIPAGAGDFRLMDRKVVESLKMLPESNRFMKGLFAWVGHRTTNVYYEQNSRFAGETKWNYWKLWNFALDGIFGYSNVPLQIWTYAGIAISSVSLFYAGYLVIKTFLYNTDLPGYPSLMAAILFFGGVNLISLGVLGEYIGRIFTESKRRPVYLVRSIVGHTTPSARVD